MITKVSANAANHYQWGEVCEGWRLLHDPALAVIAERMPPGSAEVKHFHRHSRQFFYVLEGLLEVRAGAGRLQLASGEGVDIPAETVHEICNTSAGDLTFLVISQPPARDDRVLVP